MKRRKSLLFLCILIAAVLELGVLSVYSFADTQRSNIKNNCDSISSYIFDGKGTLLVPGDDGFIEVSEDDTYTLDFSFTAKNGITSGKYYYPLNISGLETDDKISSGEIKVTDGTTIATWTIEDDKINFDFNEKSTDYTNIIATVELSCYFKGDGKEIELDGNVKVKIIGKEEDEKITGIKKVGSASGFDTDDPKLNWNIDISGGEDFSIVGKVLTDTLGKDQYYFFDYLEMNASDGNNKYHFKIPVSSLVLNPSGSLKNAISWSYTFPKKLTDTSGVERTLSDLWNYSIDYVTKPIFDKTSQVFTYKNSASLNGKTTEGDVQVDIDVPQAEAEKSVKDASEDSHAKNWSFAVKLPPSSTSDGFKYPSWIFSDIMYINNNSTKVSDKSGLENAKVTINYGGKDYVAIKYVEGIVPASEFIYILDSTYKEATIYLMKKCTCSSASYCGKQTDGACDTYFGIKISGYCACWNIESEVIVKFTYSTDDVQIHDWIEQYPSSDLINEIYVYQCVYGGGGSGKYYKIKGAEAKAETRIPGMIIKDYTEGGIPNIENGYKAEYTITLNEGKKHFVSDGDIITVVDKLSPSLRYLDGNIQIISEDASGKISKLSSSEYKLTYDKNAHILRVVILYPKPVMYTLKYQALIINPLVGLQYYNSAKVQILGQNYGSATEVKYLSNVSSYGEQFIVTVRKKDADSKGLVIGAVYGLYKSDGTLIASGEIGDDGAVTFYTIAQQVVLNAHTPYYIAEISAPEGYKLSDEKYYFFFCNESEKCEKCSVFDSAYIRLESDGEIVVYDEKIPTTPPDGGDENPPEDKPEKPYKPSKIKTNKPDLVQKLTPTGVPRVSDNVNIIPFALVMLISTLAAFFLRRLKTP